MSSHNLSSDSDDGQATTPRHYQVGTTLQKEMLSGLYQAPFIKSGPNIYRAVHRPFPESFVKRKAVANEEIPAASKQNTRTKSPCRLKVLDKPEEVMLKLNNEFSHVEVTKRVSVNKTSQELREIERKAKMKEKAHLFNTKYHAALSRMVIKTPNTLNLLRGAPNVSKLQSELPVANLNTEKQIKEPINETNLVTVNPACTSKQQNMQVEHKDYSNTAQHSAANNISVEQNLTSETKLNKISAPKDVLEDAPNASKSHNKLSPANLKITDERLTTNKQLTIGKQDESHNAIKNDLQVVPNIPKSHNKLCAANLKVMEDQHMTNKQCTRRRQDESHNSSVAIKNQIQKTIGENLLAGSKRQSKLHEID